jgi:hypothetical protein
MKLKPVKKKLIDEFLRKRLDKKGFKMNHQKSEAIVAEKDKILIYISTMGLKEKIEKSTAEFTKALFQSFDHLEKQDLKYSVVAMPIDFFVILRKFISQKKSAWVRICIGFPEIRFYFIDLENKKIHKKKLIEVINDDDEI